jgi:hypothetical protein
MSVEPDAGEVHEDAPVSSSDVHVRSRPFKAVSSVFGSTKAQLVAGRF